ncbi:hypothetical protein CK203_049444 [Vitis vinifera]|uniref:Reverse transcriptase domain-containing protein n=1 Tax=Vitis vinifera TaxID=29760 RepID=A0A438HAW5_VITVI|nr:hypothetical protein CK203_049444 [Vitis vinifera]
MSGSIKTPIFGLFDVFGVMAIESVVEIDPLIPEVTPPFGAWTVILESNATCLFCHMLDCLAEVEVITPSLEFACKRDDVEKNAFIIEWGTYCYRVMPLGLKNRGTTYKRIATTLFHDTMHRDVEVYIDDMIVNPEIKQIT